MDTASTSVAKGSRGEGGEGGEGAPTVRRLSGPALAGTVVVGLVALGLLVFFVSLYPAKGFLQPVGWDTPRYLWRTTLVAADGMRALREPLPLPAAALPSRPAFPVLALSLSSVSTLDTVKIAAALPIAGAVALALAAGALVTSTLRRGLLDLAVVTLAVGASTMVIRLLSPETYTDNLVAGAVLLASLASLHALIRGRGGWPAPALLLLAGALAHAPMFAVVVGVLGVVALVNLPRSLRARRSGTPLLQTTTGRIGGAVAAAGAAFGALLFGVLGTAPDVPVVHLSELTSKLSQDVPRYRFPITLPAALIGAGALAWPAREDDRDGSRFLLTVLAVWSGAIAAALLASRVVDRIPAHRLLALLLPLPVFGALGLLRLGRAIGGRADAGPVVEASGLGVRGQRSGARRVGAVVVVVAGLAVTLWWGNAQWYGSFPWRDQGKAQDAANAAAYVAAAVPPGTPVIAVVDDTGPKPGEYLVEIAHIYRSAIPADQIPRTYFYVGDASEFLAGRPTHRGSEAYDRTSDDFWRSLQPVLRSGRYVAVLPGSYNPTYADLVGSHPMVASNVLGLVGPVPPAPIPGPLVGTTPASWPKALVLGLGVFAALGLAGLGWAFAMGPRSLRWFEAVALAPALGLAVIVLAGTAVDAAGLRLAGAVGASVLPAGALLGAGLAWARRSRRHEGPATTMTRR